MMNPFTPYVQKILTDKVQGEKKMYEYFAVIREFPDAYRNCDKMLQSDKGWAIRNPLYLLSFFRNRTFVNNFVFKKVMCCTACHVCLPEEQKNCHICSVVDAASQGFISLRSQRFESYLKEQVNMLTDPQRAVYEIFRPILSKEDGEYSHFNRFGSNVILYGPPGTGKSFVHKLIVWAHYRIFGWDSIIVGAMAKAQANELECGETINSITGVNIINDEDIERLIAPLVPFNTEKENIQKVEEFLSKCNISDAKMEKITHAK
jgi:hypothetical protein